MVAGNTASNVPGIDTTTEMLTVGQDSSWTNLGLLTTHRPFLVTIKNMIYKIGLEYYTHSL